MTDFVLNAPGTTNNPWTPSGLIIPVGVLQTDATGIRAWFPTPTFAHSANYGQTITAGATLAQANYGDGVFLGAVVRSGPNAGCCLGVYWNGGDLVKASTIDAADTFTDLIPFQTMASALTNTAVLACTVSISGGAATISATVDGVSVLSGITTSTYANESTLAAGGLLDPTNQNATYIAQFTGTGVIAPTRSFVFPRRGISPGILCR